jgi:hypothetical protein
MAVVDATVAERSERPRSRASWTPRLVVGAALLLSSAAHITLLGSVLFANPRANDAPPPKSIMVDLVPAKQAPPAAKPELPKLELPKPQALAAKREKPASSSARESPPRAASPEPAAPPLPPAAPTTRAEPRPAPAVPDDAGEAAVRIARLMHLGELNPDIIFEAPPSRNEARLSRSEIAAFKAHLKTCWKPPAGVPQAENLKAAIRIALRPNGRFGKEPVLLAASASIHGPALVKSALAALTQCQPYTVLPARKYQEWRQLDLRFTSRDILDVRSGKGFGARNARR